MVLDRESRTAPRRDFPILEEKRGKEYAEYLQSLRWRRIRNAALMRAGYRCEDCSTRKGLQVHHLSYARLGNELPADLCVLCDPCHVDAHRRLDYAKSPAVQRDVLVRLVSLTLAEEPSIESTSTIVEAVKVRCAQLRIAYDAAIVWSAVRDLVGKRGIVMPPPKEHHPAPPPPDPGPVSRKDAHRLMEALPFPFRIKTMPKAEVMPAGAVDAFRQACGLWNRPDLDPQAFRPATVDPVPLPNVMPKRDTE